MRLLMLTLVGIVCCDSFSIVSKRALFSPSISFATQRRLTTTTTMTTTTMSTTSDATTAYNAYPLSQLADLKKQHQNVKTVHIIRHAEGTHNVNNQYKDEINLDARLTDTGIAQCKSVADTASSTSSFDKVDLILTSTMTRCIQTALYCFPKLAEDQTIPFVANEDLRETVNFACDKRRTLSQIAVDFPQVDYSEIPDEDDAIWSAYEKRLGADWNEIKESAELYKVAERGRSFWKYLAKRPEKEVIICTHSAFLRCTLSWGQEGGVQFMPPQSLDERHKQANGVVADIPLFKFNGGKEFENYARTDYANCELRSFCVVLD